MQNLINIGTGLLNGANEALQESSKSVEEVAFDVLGVALEIATQATQELDAAQKYSQRNSSCSR